MDKCHCSNVKFEKVVEMARQKGCSAQAIAEELEISRICTACKDDFNHFCQKHL
ncbi:MAG: hypothetical protein H7A25_02295 [Leptospiraceae bacterium]|nr:hypothetical protein [Leptospiraceae bacterium]MCP5498707.1 hypothetical protein [Leptospiraceae bacterium]